MTRPRPAAFDAFAAAYDHDFTATTLGRLLRRRVWRLLHGAFPPGSHVLELACGTGVDAVWLAHRGVRVTATDGSPAMVDVTRARLIAENVEHLVSAECRSLQQLAATQWPAQPPFDGAFSNFGGLNTVPHLSSLASSLARAVRPGGRLVLVPMGPFCPWELLWYLAHGDLVTALRRFRQPATARIGDQSIAIWYPRLRHLRRAFTPLFRHHATYSLGLWLPPSYLGHLVERFPRLFQRLNRLEAATARRTAGWGDHYVSVFERTLTPSNRSSMRSPSRAAG